MFSVVIAGNRSRAYRVIEKYELDLFMPEESLLEFHRHAEKLRRYAVKDFETKAMLAFMLVHIVPRELYEDKLRDTYINSTNKALFTSTRTLNKSSLAWFTP